MRRRSFLRTSAGLTLMGLLPGYWSCNNPLLKQHADRFVFRSYRPGNTLGPTRIVTPPGRYFTNTYYNYNPWSPNGRYLALTELPYQDRVTELGDIAYVVVIDLEAQRIRRVYPTRSWGYQYGALVQWGADDDTLYCNDVNEAGRAVGVRIDLASNDTFVTDGPLMDVDPVRDVAIGPSLEYLNATQYSYGPPAAGGESGTMATLPPGASDTEGVWQTDLRSGRRELLIPATELAAASTQEDQLSGYAHYVFSCRFSPDYQRIGIVQRRASKDPKGKVDRNPSLLSYEVVTGKISEAVSTEQWEMGAHHSSWHPDSFHFTMNMTPKWLGDDKLRFVQFRYDGKNFTVLSDSILGSGHPSMRTGGRYLLSDAYPFEPLLAGEGEIPIRLIDLQEQREYIVATIFTDLGQQYDIRRYWGPSKLDAHPTWNASFDQVCFNGAPEGKRAVLITDLQDFFE